MAIKIISKRSGIPVGIINTPKAAAKTAPLPPVVTKPAKTLPRLERGPRGRPVLDKAVKIGNSTIMPDIDMHDVLGGCKFLVHLKKKGIWYKVVGYDEAEGSLKLLTQAGVAFDGHMHRTVGSNYMVVMEHGISVPYFRTNLLLLVQARDG